MKNFILYKGPSVLDGSPIVVLAVVKSNNRKTGSMIQTHILRDDISPLDAIKNGQDSSICGNCPLRQGIGGACYVNVGQGPNSAWKSYKKGNYATPSMDEIKTMLKGKLVRLGAYGDPAAVPVSVWNEALENARGWTGYTHQSKHKNFDTAILKWCMVSAETANQAKEYHAQGLRTFRVITEDAPRFDNEIECPSEQGYSCVECKKCDGAQSQGESITIMVHGSRSNKHNKKYANANLIAVAS